MTDSTSQLECTKPGQLLEPPAPLAGGDYRSAPDWWWLALALPFALCDFLMVPVFSSFNTPPGPILAAFAFAVIGCTLAQGCILAAWLVWSVGPFPRRLSRHWAAAAVLYACWLMGAALVVSRDDDFFTEVMPTIGLAVPVVSLAVQLPLWIVRHSFGWRVVRQDYQADVAADSPLTIRDLLLATLIVGVSCGLVRLAPPFQTEKEFGFAGAVALTVAAIISTIAMLPAGALLLRMRRFRLGLLVSGLYAGLFVTTEWLIVVILYWRGTRALPPYEVCVGLTGLMLSFAATLVVVASAVRAKGYRMVWGRRRTPTRSVSEGQSQYA